MQHNPDDDELVELSNVIERVRVATRAKAPSMLERAPVLLGDDELIISRTDLRTLLEAATWRAGFMEGCREGRRRR